MHDWRRILVLACLALAIPEELAAPVTPTDTVTTISTTTAASVERATPTPTSTMTTDPASPDQDAVTPIVIMHGIYGDAQHMETVVSWIKESLPGTYVVNMEIGDGAKDSHRMAMSDQVKEFCRKIYADPQLARGFHLIGYSQGGLVTRGYIQRCNKYPVRKYLSWNSPQGGQFGAIDSFGPMSGVAFNAVAYEDWFQKRFSAAQYWRDPHRLLKYIEVSEYLADLNNERESKNAQYVANMASLEGVMLQYSPDDGVISPPISGWFGSYYPDTETVMPMQESLGYKENWIGLRTLHESGRIHFRTSNCNHTAIPTEECKETFLQNSLPFLMGTAATEQGEGADTTVKQPRPAARSNGDGHWRRRRLARHRSA